MLLLRLISGGLFLQKGKDEILIIAILFIFILLEFIAVVEQIADGFTLLFQDVGHAI